MKNIIAKLACVLLGLALFAGCESTDANKAPATSPGRVTILFSKPEKSYVDVGTVSALKVQPTPGETWQQALQKQAAGRGADAVIVDTSMLNNTSTTMVSGKAIRYAQ